METATQYGGICDISPMGKLDVQGTDALSGVGGLLNLSGPLRVGGTQRDEERGVTAIGLAFDEALVLTPAGEVGPIVEQLEKGLDGCAHLVDVTSAWAGIAVVGPLSYRVLSKVAELDLDPSVFPNGGCVQGKAAEVHAIIVRSDVGKTLGYQVFGDQGLRGIHLGGPTSRGAQRWGGPHWPGSNERTELELVEGAGLLQLFRKDRMWRSVPLGSKYDIVIIGAGVHGLSTAYYLGKRGITNVALLDKGYLGGGASARSTAILRANYVTTEGIPFFHESLKLYEDLAQDLNYNMLFSQFGRLELAHTESSIYALRNRVEFNAAMDVDSRLVGPDEIKDLVPPLDLRQGKDLPVLAGLYHPPRGCDSPRCGNMGLRAGQWTSWGRRSTRLPR